MQAIPNPVVEISRLAGELDLNEGLCQKQPRSVAPPTSSPKHPYSLLPHSIVDLWWCLYNRHLTFPPQYTVLRPYSLYLSHEKSTLYMNNNNNNNTRS